MIDIDAIKRGAQAIQPGDGRVLTKEEILALVAVVEVAAKALGEFQSSWTVQNETMAELEVVMQPIDMP